MKEEFKAIGWLISSTARFILALFIIFAVFFGGFYLFILAKESGIGHVIVYILCSICFLFSSWCFYIAYKQHLVR